MHSRTRFVGILLVGVALFAAALACNLEIGGEQPDEIAALPTLERPTVEFLTPEEGKTFTVDQAISVAARATSASGVTLVELLVNDVPVDSQPPADELNPTTLDVVMEYQPERPGTFKLEVRAYSNTVVGQPALRFVTVLPELDPGDGGVGNNLTALPATPTPFNAICRAYTNTRLNFRTGPSTRYTVITTLNAGSEVPIIGYADGPEGDGRWWQVQASGQNGWISAAYTKQLGNCVNVLPASYPALPTATPTNTPLPGVTNTPTLPDLRLSLLEGPAEITLNERGTAQGTYIIEVQNRGGQASRQFRIAVLMPSGEVRTFDVPGLNPNQTFRVPSDGLTVTFNSPGFTRVLVTVDDTNRVTESDETNNQAYRDIRVQYGPPTLTPVAPTNTPVPSATPQPTNTPFAPTNTPVPTDVPTDVPPPTEDDQPAPLSPITGANAGAVAQISQLSGHGGNISAVAFNPAGTVLASGSRDGTVRLWDAVTGAELRILPHDDRVRVVVFNPNGSEIATLTQGGTVRLWDVTSGTEFARFEHGAEASALAYSPDGARIASGGRNPDAEGGLMGLARVWETGSGAELGAFQTFGPVVGVGFLNNDTLVTGAQGQTCERGGGGVEIFSVGSGESTGTLGDTEWVNALTVDPATARIAASGQASTCSGNGIVWVWQGGGSLLATLDHGSSTGITGMAFNAGGGLLASSSEDGRVRLWDLGTNAQVAVLTGHTEALSVAFRPNGTLLASGGSDSVVRLWGVP